MDSEKLRKLARQNDEAAQRELFEAFYRRTYAVVFSILRHHESAEDITQDVFIKAFQNLKQLREPEKFGAWLAVIGSNLARNHFKREKKVVYSDDMAPFENGGFNSTEEIVLRDLQGDQVRRAIRELPHEQYQVVILQYYYDLKIEEIATLLKISAGTVKSRLFRAREKLARILEPIVASDGLHYKGGSWSNAGKPKPLCKR